MCSDRVSPADSFQYLEATLDAIRGTNRRADLLPNITLGYAVLDVCARDTVSVDIGGQC